MGGESKNQFWLKLVKLPQVCHWKHEWGEAEGATLTQPIAQFLLYPKDTGGNFDPFNFFFFFSTFYFVLEYSQLTVLW